ncbi:MAG TPA: hypothetical protein VMZ74_05735 [Ramlibacter sp.]|nr:hypothetical protein [Ramlibacter sp.]
MSGREYWDQWERSAGAVEVLASELVVTTAAGAEIREYAPLAALLQRVHKAFGIEIAFVSEWSGVPVARLACEADALHTLYGRRFLESGAPAGTASRFEALPVVSGDGLAHGTLCFRVPTRQALDAEIESALRSVARLIANWFEAAAA